MPDALILPLASQVIQVSKDRDDYNDGSSLSTQLIQEMFELFFEQ